jgi:hypothetical protein
MQRNPLKKKLVDHPKGWPWSSFSFYANPKQGLIRIDPIRGIARTEKEPKPSAPSKPEAVK